MTSVSFPKKFPYWKETLASARSSFQYTRFLSRNVTSHCETTVCIHFVNFVEVKFPKSLESNENRWYERASYLALFARHDKCCTITFTKHVRSLYVFRKVPKRLDVCPVIDSMVKRSYGRRIVLLFIYRTISCLRYVPADFQDGP